MVKGISGVITAMVMCFSISGMAASPDETAFPPAGKALEIKGKLGNTGARMSVVFKEKDSKKKALILNILCSDIQKRPQHSLTGLKNFQKDFKDAGYMITVANIPDYPGNAVNKFYFIRPDIHFYYGEDFTNAVNEWEKHKPASEHEFKLSIEHGKEFTELWIDGRFIARVENNPDWEKIQIGLGPGAEVLEKKETASAIDGRFLPLDISENRHRGKENVIVDVSPAPGPQSIEEVPFNVASPEKAVDVGMAKWLRQEQDSRLFYHAYYGRTGWDNLAETIIFNVPKGYYNYLWLLCAVEPETEKKIPEMTVRVALYRQTTDGGGATQADTAVRIDEKNPVNCQIIKKIGTVDMSVSGEKKKAPLYLVCVPLSTGELAGYLGQSGFTKAREKNDALYVELTRKLETRLECTSAIYEKVPLGNQSSIHVLGMTLEKAPLEAIVTSAESGNIFELGKNKPEMEVDFKNPGKTVALNADIKVSDFYGNTKALEQKFKVASGESKSKIDLSGFKPGWYKAEFSFMDEKNRVLWYQPTTFAILPPDTREAGVESPFNIWWFHGRHYTEPDANRVLPIVEKMGFRHIGHHRIKPNEEKQGITRENFLKHKITPDMSAYFRPRKIEKGKRIPLEGEDLYKEQQKKIKEFVDKFPETRYVMIFHETPLGGLGIGLPPEILGEKAPALEGEDKEKEKELIEQLKTQSQAIRDTAPQVKILVGNGLTNFNLQWLRKKDLRKYWDYIGMEHVIQTSRPEAQPNGYNTTTTWLYRKMFDIYGYDNYPVATCYEFEYRPTAPGGLTLKQQADWYTRDLLHHLAYKLPYVSLALVADANNSYYTGRWGSVAVCYRAPLMTPKPSYVALATLTRVLDRVEFQRWLPVGSTGAYCLEFKKPDGSYVYAMWTSTGTAKAEIKTDASGKFTLTDIMGVEKKLNASAKIAVELSESPVYLTCAKQVKSCAVIETKHNNVELADAQTLDTLNKANAWKTVAEGDEKFQNYCPYLPLRKGDFTLSNADGAVKVTMKPQPEVPEVCGQYAYLKPASGSVAVKGKPDTVGIWVNGNSNWGRVVFELIDAKGRTWRSLGWDEGDAGWDMADWQAETYINFDGWKFISVKLPGQYPSGYYTPSFKEWRCLGDNSKNNQIAYPVKFTGLFVMMREKLVYITDMIPAKSLDIEFKNLSFGSQKTK